MKRFTKPILIGIVLAWIAIIAAFVMFLPKSPTGVPSQSNSLQEAEDMSLSARLDPVEAKANNPAPQPKEKHDAPLSTHIIAAVLSNDTKATSLSKTQAKNAGVSQQPPVALIDSPLAEKWLREDGITRSDIETAQGRLRDSGFPLHMQEDPSLVQQYLPRRNIQAAHVHSFSIAEKARTGEAIPFSMGGALPDSSYEFTHFDIIQNSNVIRILPIGSTSGDAAPGEEIPINLAGAINPLPAGIYHIEFPELGPDGSYELIVE